MPKVSYMVYTFSWGKCFFTLNLSGGFRRELRETFNSITSSRALCYHLISNIRLLLLAPSVAKPQFPGSMSG